MLPIVIGSLWLLAIVFLVIVYLKSRFTLLNYQAPVPSIESKSIPIEGVSIIICAHNELKNLQRLLPKLYDQDYPNYEIVVVCDRSSDGTFDFLLEQKAAYNKLKVVWVRHRPPHIKGKKYALTLGIKAATHDILLLTDADCLPTSCKWVSTMSKAFTENVQIILGYSPYQANSGILNAYVRYDTLHTAGLYFSAALAGRPFMGVGRNLAYRKSWFMGKNGFAGITHIVGGDDDLLVNNYATSANTEVSFGYESHMVSLPKQSWKQLYRQKKRHLSVGKYYNNRDKVWLGSLSLANLVFWIGWIGLTLAGYEPIFIATGLILKWISQFFFLRTTANTLKDPLNLALLPILDFLYVIYYVLLGISAISSKNTQWN